MAQATRTDDGGGPGRARPAAADRPARAAGGAPPALLAAGYMLVCIAPLVLAGAQGRPWRNLLHELSTGLVMVGFVMALVQFILSGRFHRVTGRAGIDRTMRFHQLVGRIVLVALFVHPLLYAAPGLLPDPSRAARILHVMFTAPRLWSGVAAWALTIPLVAMAIWRDRLPMRYEVWRLSHGLLAVAVAALGTHHALRVGLYSADPWLGGFWVLATMAALASLLYVDGIRPLMQLARPYRVVANRPAARGMWELVIEPQRGDAIDFAPGQFVWLNLGHSPFSLTEHPFSISSPPSARPRLAFTIKESGDFTNRIGEVALGTRAYLDGPHGGFTLAGRPAGGLVFIAGGVGIAPVMSLLRDLADRSDASPVRLVYGNRLAAQILYRDELAALERRLDFSVRHVLSEPPEGWSGLAGEISPDLIGRCLDEFGAGDWLYFVCGPPAMMDAVEGALAARGVARRRIVSERFRYA